MFFRSSKKLFVSIFRSVERFFPVWLAYLSVLEPGTVQLHLKVLLVVPTLVSILSCALGVSPGLRAGKSLYFCLEILFCDSLLCLEIFFSFTDLL